MHSQKKKSPRRGYTCPKKGTSLAKNMLRRYQEKAEGLLQPLWVGATRHATASDHNVVAVVSLIYYMFLQREAIEHPMVQYSLTGKFGLGRFMRRMGEANSTYYTLDRSSSAMHRWTAPSLKVLGRARMLGLGPTYFFMASANASSKVALVFRPMLRAIPGSWAPTM